MHQGIFIVVEGSDGAGKGTQFKLLSERLKAEGYDVTTYDFPQYQSGSSYFVQQYLNGQYGDAETLGPYVPSIFYALDRFDVSAAIKEDLAAGRIVLANRFTGSNMAQQGGKLPSLEEKAALFKWLDQLEFDLLDIPRPDLNLVLVVPAETAQQLIGKKSARRYTDKLHDIHENDLEHLKNAVNTFELLCQTFPETFIPVHCWRNGELLSITAINNLIWERISPMLARFLQSKRPKHAKLTAAKEATAKSSKQTSAQLSFLAAAELQLSLAPPSSALKAYTPSELKKEDATYYQKQMAILLSSYQSIVEQLSDSSAVMQLLPTATLGEANSADVKESSTGRALAELQTSSIANDPKPSSTLTELAQAKQLTPIKGSDDHEVALIDFWPKNELALIPDLLFAHSTLSAAELSNAVSEWSYEEKASALQKFVQAADTPLELTAATYRFELITSFSEYLAFQQHRLGKTTRQPLSPHYGFAMPASISENGLVEQFEHSYEVSRELYQNLLGKGYEQAAEYAILLGHKLRWSLQINGAELKKLFTLHSADLQNILENIKTSLSEAHPLMADTLTF